MKDSLTNTACAIRTPIPLPGWGHIAAATRILADNRCSWSFGKVDHKAAYNDLPIKPEDSSYAAIALWGPRRLIWCGCRSRTQLFGSTAAVLRYNALSRIIASPICRILAIPTMGYFGDFGFITRTADRKETMKTLIECLTLFRARFEGRKSAIGNSNTFLGLSAFFPQYPNQMSLAISSPREKARRWDRAIFDILREKSISHAAIESLVGRLSFARPSVFGRFARAMLKPLYVKLYSKRYFPSDPTGIGTQPPVAGRYPAQLNPSSGHSDEDFPRLGYLYRCRL